MDSSTSSAGSTLSHPFSAHFTVERTPKTFFRQSRLGACLGVGMCHYPDGWVGHSLRSSTIQMNPCGPKSNLVRLPIKGNERNGEPQGLNMGYRRGLRPVPNLQCTHLRDPWLILFPSELNDQVVTKKKQKFLSEVILARSTLTILDLLQASRATASGMSLAPNYVP